MVMCSNRLLTLMKARSRTCRLACVLAFAFGEMQASADDHTVTVELHQSAHGENASNLSPSLSATKASGGVLKAGDPLGRIVVAVPPEAISILKDAPAVKSVTEQV